MLVWGTDPGVKLFLVVGVEAPAVREVKWRMSKRRDEDEGRDGTRGYCVFGCSGIVYFYFLGCGEEEIGMGV